MEIKRHSDGSYLVEVALPEWESFFHQYGLKAIGSGEREGITSQLQVGGVYKDALTSDPPKPTEKRGQHNLLKNMHLLRVGSISTGVLSPGAAEINKRLDPPRVNWRMSRAKQNLVEALEFPLREYILDHKEEVMAVRDWLHMKEPMKAVPKAKGEDDGKRTFESGGSRTNFTPATKKRSVAEKAPTEEPPAEVSPAEVSPAAEQFDLPDIVRKEFPVMSTFTEGDLTRNWDEGKKSRLDKELKKVLERLERDDVPKDVEDKFPTLAAFLPEILYRGD